ncbi:Protein arginine N-methyltransferase 3 [Boothiomyces sp. JEL0866]|nr:Protein arginine N-methyltransferase 3 [Boothiomyces sp. JEL0866]
MDDDANSDVLVDENDTWSNYGDWEDNDETPTPCPFCPEIIPTDCFSHFKSVHEFDFHSIKRQLKLDFYQMIKLVNYARTVKCTMEQVIHTQEWNDDKYLAPVLPDDPLLYAFEDDDEEEEQDELTVLRTQLQQVLQQNKDLKDTFDTYKIMVEKTFLPISEPTEKPKNDVDGYYFDSYTGTDIHETMLKDSVRTEGYRDFIYENKLYFKDKIVLDVGCGTGILSMFAAKAGAKKVYAVDNSQVIARAKEIVKENELDHVISFFQGKIEEIELPSKVDVIISEWMGYFLLFEGMLDSVLVARDKWLEPDGMMAPSRTDILFAAVDDENWLNDNINFWNDVYGFKMSIMKNDVYTNGQYTIVPKDGICSNSCLLSKIETKTVAVKELDFVTEFVLDISRDGTVYAFCGWFDTFFEKEGCESVYFSTGPFTKPTHWVQTLFNLHSPLKVKKNDKITGKFHVSKSASNYRELDVKIEYAHGTQAFTQKFKVA